MSRKSWLRVKEVFMEMDLKIMEGNEAFYFLHKEGKLKGAILTHIDDFKIAGDDDFMEMALVDVGRELTISKVEKDKFCFTGLYIASVKDGIEVSMDGFVQSLKEIKEIRKGE